MPQLGMTTQYSIGVTTFRSVVTTVRPYDVDTADAWSAQVGAGTLESVTFPGDSEPFWKGEWTPMTDPTGVSSR